MIADRRQWRRHKVEVRHQFLRRHTGAAGYRYILKGIGAGRGSLGDRARS